MPFVALLDANVLYPATLRNVLLSVAEAGLYRVIWTEEILEEMTRNILAKRADLSAERLEKTVRSMNAAFPDALVGGYKRLQSSMTNDEGDRHVLAAAVRGRADVIVTSNTKHFPPECCEEYDIDVQTPDQFLLYAYDLRPERFMSALETMLSRCALPPQNLAELLDSLSASTPELVERLRTAS